MKKTKECYCVDYKDFKVIDKSFLNKFHQKAKQLVKPIAKWAGRGIALASLIYTLSPKQADAQGFDSFNRGQYAPYSISYVVSPTGNDTISDVANIYVPNLDGWYWTCTAPGSWNVQPEDTCDVFAKNGTKRQDTWISDISGGANIVMPLFLDEEMNYTIASKNVNNTLDTLVEGTLVLKHDGKTSDPVIDTFWINSAYHDIYFNLAKSDSAWNWANGDWSNLYGDSVSISLNAINYPDTGSTSGIINGFQGDGQILEDIIMGTGIYENGYESKIYSQNLQAKPSIGKRFEISNDAYIGKKKDLKIYSGIGGLVRVINSNTGKWVWDGKDDKGNKLPKGAYFVIVDSKRTKLVKPE